METATDGLLAIFSVDSDRGHQHNKSHPSVLRAQTFPGLGMWIINDE